ncbi:MAG: MerR family transcriptional regulator [Actinomycetota bacterium]
MPTRAYLSIGEVLVHVKTEFPDITISKIRFLEAEGLIDPERTPSGYRKFYDTDVARLRAILRLQRDEYLPLRVIKERLRDEEREAAAAADGQEPAERTTATATVLPDVAEPPVGLQMPLEEISAATGVETSRILELEGFGLVCAHGPEGARYYDGEDLVVLSAVREFFRHGVEPRHLAMYRHFAEREASFFESIVLPQVRRRNPDAQRGAADSLRDLSGASRKLASALLRRTLDRDLG